uniref:Uncharacterized protein n=1 Tax=Callorhinchus milii TaxID=7868 RepID=A0A4W3K543_CALMI
MQRGHIEGEELPEDNTAQDHANFQMPPVRLAATGMDSAPTSGENTEDELEAVQNQGPSYRQFVSSATRQLLGERSSFRPWLEGGSSDESTEAEDENNGLEFRRSAEGQVINSPVVGDGGGAGDGSSGSEDDGNGGGVATVPSGSTTYDDPWGLGIAGRNVAGEEDDNNTSTILSSAHDDLQSPGIGGRNVAGEDQGPNPLPLQGSKELLHGQNETGSRLGPVGNGEVSEFISGTVVSMSTTHRQEVLDAMDSRGLEEMKLDSVYFGPASGNITTDQLVSVQDSPFQFSQLACSPSDGDNLGLRDGPCGYATVGQTSVKENRDDADPTPNSTLDAPLAAAYLSPIHPEESATDIWQFERNTDWNSGCFHQENGGKEESCPDVVYQNEEGSWVTDLAYYYSLDKEQEQFNLPSDVAQQIPEEEFIAGNQAVALLKEDQEIFEQEHKFIQEDKMDVDADFHGDNSWQLPSNKCSILRASQTASGCMQGNESYLRLSLGEFFGQRSEALGCLGEECSGIKRPSFGYAITSPEKRTPVALILPGSMSRTLTDQDEMDLLCGDENLSSDDLECTYQETPTEASPTFVIDEEIESGKLGTSMVQSSNGHVHDFDDRKVSASNVPSF